MSGQRCNANLQNLRLMRLFRYTDLVLGRSVLGPALIFRRDRCDTFPRRPPATSARTKGVAHSAVRPTLRQWNTETQ